MLRNNDNLMVQREVLIIGVMKQGGLFSMAGIFVDDELAEKQFGTEPTRIMFSIPSDMSIEEREHLAKQLESSFVEYGMSVRVIEVEVIKIQSLIISIFNIFELFLALGLAVGIAGLAVVTMRAVSERQHQTGVLRALGFDRNMVLFGYLLELTWISLLGMLNGVLVAVAFHYQLYRTFWQEQGEVFTMPWGQIALLVAISYALVLLSTAVPVRRASRIHPAEALRQVD